MPDSDNRGTKSTISDRLVEKTARAMWAGWWPIAYMGTWKEAEPHQRQVARGVAEAILDAIGYDALVAELAERPEVVTVTWEPVCQVEIRYKDHVLRGDLSNTEMELIPQEDP